MRIRAVLLFLSITVAGCSFDAGSTNFESDELGPGFDLSEGSDDTGENDAEGISDGGALDADPLVTDMMSPPSDMTTDLGLGDMTTTSDMSTTRDASNDASSADLSSTDMSQMDMSQMDMSSVDMSQMDMTQTGACVRNNECPAGQVCCPDLQGDGTCQTNCLVDGLCTDNSDCSSTAQCCDLGNIGVQNKLCSANCGGGAQTNCQTNSDCMGNEVCCPNLRGGTECTTSCVSGGACNTDSDCRGNQECCNLVVGKQCFDRCSF